MKSGARIGQGKWRPHFSVDIRGGGTGMFILKRGSEEIGSISAHHQFREAYLKAIYMHGGSTYRVDEITQDEDGGKISLSSAEPHLRTNPSLFTTLTQQDIYSGLRWSAGALEVDACYGRVNILERLVSVEEVDERTGNVSDKWTPDMQPSQFANAHAFWIVGTVASSPDGGLLALQHLLRVGVSFVIPIDAHDVFPYADGKERTAYLVESYRGGIGIARKMLQRWREVLRRGVEVANQCECRKGCPNCIVPPRSTEELDKQAGIAFAEELLAAGEGDPDAKFVRGLWTPITRTAEELAGETTEHPPPST